MRKPPKPSGKTYINGIIKEQKEYYKLDKSHKKKKKVKNMGKKKKKRQEGIRHINGNDFLRGKNFHTRKKEAKRSQKIFQDRNHLTRILPAKKDKKKGYRLYYSEERIRKK